MIRALAVSLVPIGALAALGGAYSSATVPLLIASAAVFVLSGARVAASPDTRPLDIALLAAVAIVLLQLAPLPPSVIAAVSPEAASFDRMRTLAGPLTEQAEPSGATRRLSIDPHATRDGLLTMISCVLLFWAARETFARGGVRVFIRAIALSGAVVSLIALVQRATAPTLILWTWRPLDPGAQPYGPFVNRNHFATWLLMASTLAAGYLVARLRAHGFEHHRSTRLLIRDLLADGGPLLLAGSMAVMLLALVGSLSRAALLGIASAAAFGLSRARRAAGKDVSLAMAGLVMAAVLAAAVWVNREGLLERLDVEGAGPGRLTIWRETMPLVADFWLTGTGVGTYGTAMMRYQVTRRGTLFNQAHNEYLQIVAEGGILLTAAAALALLAWIRAARGVARTRGHWIRVGAAAGMCAVAVQSLFETGLRMPANALLFAVLAAVVAHRDRAADPLLRQDG